MVIRLNIRSTVISLYLAPFLIYSKCRILCQHASLKLRDNISIHLSITFISLYHVRMRI